MVPTGRRTAIFGLADRSIGVYEMNRTQKLALGMAMEMAKKKSGMAMVRIWAVIEALVIDPADWEYIDDGFLSGALSIEELWGFVGDVVKYKWSDEDTPAAGADSAA